MVIVDAGGVDAAGPDGSLPRQAAVASRRVIRRTFFM
jgi:hypothetical protein